MKNIRSFAIIFLALSLMLCVFCACEPKPAPETPAPDDTTETPKETLLQADISKYTITVSRNAGSDLKNASSQEFRTELMTALGKSYIGYQNDENPATELEILIGLTNRPESTEFLAGLRYKDYGYTVINKKIVIAGHTDETTLAAIELFQNEVLGGTFEEGVFMTCEANVVRETYATDDMMLGSLSVNGLKIVYPKENKHFEKVYAEQLATLLSEVSGYYIPVHADNKLTATDTDELLIIGTSATIQRIITPDSLKAGEAYITSNDNTILVTGVGSLGIYGAVSSLQERIEEKEGQSMSVKEERFMVTEEDTIKTMSFNLLVGERSTARDERVIKMIKSYMPDTLGVQEASPDWITTLDEALSSKYAYVGLGRDGETKGEYTAIFYLKDKYTLIDWGTKWLSDTPDEVSKIPEAALNRTFTYAILERNSDGKRFVHVNTHLDHTNNDARTKQVNILLELLEKFQDYPVLITGDFNCEAGTTPYKAIINAGYTPSSALAEIAEINETYHNYQNLKGDQYIIDFCFVTPTKMAILNYKVCNEMINGNYASDHHPILTEFLLP